MEIERNLFDQLNELYIDSRYPTELGLLPSGRPDTETANEFYSFAKNIRDKITIFLNDLKDST